MNKEVKNKKEKKVRIMNHGIVMREMSTKVKKETEDKMQPNRRTRKKLRTNTIQKHKNKSKHSRRIFFETCLCEYLQK